MKLVNSERKIRRPLVWLEISKKNLLYNLDQIKKLCGPSKIMAMVKANAYGLGAAGIAKTIQNSVDAFGVVGLKEGVTLREIGITKPIINLGIFCWDDAENLIKSKISPSLFTYQAVKDFAEKSRRVSARASVWIKVDTGLNRLGVPYSQAFEFIKYVSERNELRIGGVVSSLAEDKKFDRVQLKRLALLKTECKKQNINIPLWSMASSEALFLFPEAYLDTVRVGIALYGYYPSKKAGLISRIELKPVASFKTRVACVKELEKGESIFYRRRFLAKKKMRVAILLPGYTYGIDPNFAISGSVLIRGKRCHLIGGVSATNMFANIGSSKDVQANDEVVIFGKQNGSEIKLEEICRTTGLSQYQTLGRIPEKVERIYV